jgi:hypothetical protein
MALSFVLQGWLVIVLDEENVERIQACDPFEFNCAKVPMPVALALPPRILIAYARKDEQQKILAMQAHPDLLLKYLSRGFRITDTDGQRGEIYKKL